MDREGFRNRMKQYKKAREENPGLKYWAWKDDVVASFRSALDSTKLDRNKVYNRIPAREWAPGKQSNDPSAIINAGPHESLYHYEFGNDGYAQQLVNAANKVIDNPRSYEYEIDDAIAYLAHEDAKDVYLGLPQRTGLVQLSVYKPTNAKDLNTIYYKFLHQTPEYWDNPNGSVIQDLLWQKFDGTNSKHYIDKTLNEFTGYISTDPNKGEYVSIYDEWDYNTAVTAGGKDNIHKYIPGSKPFEIYDRIYLDDYYGINSAPEKGDHYGGYLPEIEIKPYAEGGEVEPNNKLRYELGLPSTSTEDFPIMYDEKQELKNEIRRYKNIINPFKLKENLLLQKLEKTAELYDIPKIKDKEITLSNAGSMTGAVLSTNMLDSIYKYSNITNLPLVEAIGLPAQESAFGKWRRINGNAYWNSSENRDTRPDKITSDWEYTDPGILQYINSSRINAGYKNSELEDSVLLWDNAKDMDRRDLLRLRAHAARLKGEAEYIKSKQNDINKIFESFSVIPPLQHAYEYYKTGKYNPGDSSHKQDVIRKGKEVMNSPEFKKWAKENGIKTSN